MAVFGSIAITALAPAPGYAQATVSFTCPSWQAGSTGRLRASGCSGMTRLTVQDSDGKTVWEKSAKAGSDGKLDAEVPVRQAGYYTLTVAGAQPVSFAVVPRKPSNTPPVSLAAPDHRLLLGVCTHFSFPDRDQSVASFTMLKNLGVDLVRDELSWGVIERAKGTYEFPERFGYVEKLHQNGIQLMIVAGYSNSLYGPGRKPPVGEGTTAYGKYCVEILKHYGSAISALEVYNEPNDFNPVTDYLPLLRDTFTQVRAAGLKQPIIAVGGAGIGGGMNPDFAAKLFDAGGAAYCDGFSQHPYTGPRLFHQGRCRA